MSSPGILLEEVLLTNGLRLRIFDQSRPMAGDRWLAKLSMQIAIEIRSEYLVDHARDDFAVDAFIASTGGTITFEHFKQRIFIDHQDLSRIIADLKAESLNSTLPYISKSGFQKRFVQKRYCDWCEQQRLQRSPAHPHSSKDAQY
jgi:hypothetical protein